MSKDLRQFLQLVKEAGPNFYVEVKKPLKPELEVSVLVGKLAAEGRFPVVYCPEIEGSKLPLVTNLAGTYELQAIALDFPTQEFKRIEHGEVFKEYRRRRKENVSLAPKEVPTSEAPVKEVILKGKDVDLNLLPIIKHAELDSGKYITAGMTICKDPDTGIPNAGVCRLELKGRNELGCLMNPANHGAYIARRYAELAKPMEVITAIGHHPAVIIGSVARGPLNMNELEVMGALLGEPLEIIRGETVSLPVPARAEIAIEGVIDPTKMVTDGPFGDYTGYYGGKQSCYLYQVKAMTMRQDAIYHSITPAQVEHLRVGLLNRESNLYDRVSAAVPSVKAVSYGCVYGHPFMYIAIKKRLQGEGKLAGLAALSADLLSKFAVVVDDDVDVYNEQEVLWAIGTRVRGDTDIVIIPGVTACILDPTAHDETGVKRGPMNAKILIDATKPVGLPFPTRLTPPKELWDFMKLEDYLR